jgi:hypothetical protein
VNLITGSLKNISGRLLEQTKIFFYPKTALGSIAVQVENTNTDYLNSEQSFTLDLYVKRAIYNDQTIRGTLEAATVTLLDSYVSRQSINMSEVREALRVAYGNSVTAFNIKGLGGSKDYQMVTLVSESDHLCLKKQLSVQADKTMIVKDAVIINFSVVP